MAKGDCKVPPTLTSWSRWGVSLQRAWSYLGDRLRAGWLNGLFIHHWEGFRESRRCSRDAYPESYITEHILIYEEKKFRGNDILDLHRAGRSLGQGKASGANGVNEEEAGRVQGLRFRVRGSGFRVQGSGFRV